MTLSSELTRAFRRAWKRRYGCGTKLRVGMHDMVWWYRRKPTVTRYFWAGAPPTKTPAKRNRRRQAARKRLPSPPSR